MCRGLEMGGLVVRVLEDKRFELMNTDKIEEGHTRNAGIHSQGLLLKVHSSPPAILTQGSSIDINALDGCTEWDHPSSPPLFSNRLQVGRLVRNLNENGQRQVR